MKAAIIPLCRPVGFYSLYVFLHCIHSRSKVYNILNSADMPDFLTQLGIEKFSDQVADKVIERGSDKIAAAVVRQIEPILKQPATAPKKEKLDPFLTRKEVAQLLNISDPTLRQKYKSGELKVYGSGTRHMRFDPADVRLYLENS